MTPSPFLALFDRVFYELHDRAAKLPAEPRGVVEHFIGMTRDSVFAIVQASEELCRGDDRDSVLFSQAGKVVAAVERLNIGQSRKVAVAALALLVIADPDFEATMARVEARVREGTS